LPLAIKTQTQDIAVIIIIIRVGMQGTIEKNTQRR